MPANRLFSGPAQQGTVGTWALQILALLVAKLFPPKDLMFFLWFLDLPPALLLRITTRKSGELMKDRGQGLHKCTWVHFLRKKEPVWSCRRGAPESLKVWWGPCWEFTKNLRNKSFMWKMDNMSKLAEMIKYLRPYVYYRLISS